MATKTIYVKDEDLPIFERAQELGGNSLSRIIVEALRRYIEVEEAKAEGFREIIISVGHTKMADDAREWRKVKFTGKLLAEADRDAPFAPADYKVYLTQKGNLLLYMVLGPMVPRESEESDEAEKDEQHLYFTYDSFDELRNAQIPAEILADVARKLGQDYIETLDV